VIEVDNYSDMSIVDGSFGQLTVEWSTEGVAVPAGLIAKSVIGVAHTETAVPSGGVIDQILAVIMGSKQTRFAPRPAAEGRAAIRERVAAAVARDAPIPLATMWGAIKHYVPDEDQEIDLAELFAAARLGQIVHDIGKIYAPGARLDVVIEDFGVWYEDAYGFPATVQASVRAGSASYADALTSLLRTIGGPLLRTHLFFDVVDSDYRENIERVERNRELLSAYWLADGSGCGEAYAALREAGWNGELIPETRLHYLRRLRKLYPQEDTSLHIERIVRYFSMVLLYQQVRLLSIVSPDAIRLAFYAPPPGPAKERAVDRIHLRGLPRRWCSAAVPPWTSKGCFMMDADGSLRPRVESFVGLVEEGRTFHRGSLRLSNGAHSSRMRMDVVCPESAPGRTLQLKHYA
jgi:hypothetical protein